MWCIEVLTPAAFVPCPYGQSMQLSLQASAAHALQDAVSSLASQLEEGKCLHKITCTQDDFAAHDWCLNHFHPHRYGPDVGEAASDLSHAAVEGGMTYFTISRMGVRSIAKRIAKRTAKGLVKSTVSGVRGYHTGGSAVQGTQDVNLR